MRFKSFFRSKVVSGLIGGVLVASLIWSGFLASPGFDIAQRDAATEELIASDSPGQKPRVKFGLTNMGRRSPKLDVLTDRLLLSDGWESRRGPLAALLEPIGEPIGPARATSQREGDQPLDFEGQIARVMDVQERYTDYLLGFPGVVGTAVGLTQHGEPAVQIYTKERGMMGVPTSLEGVPVIVAATGEFFAMGRNRGNFQSTASVNPKSRFTLPVPIGVSTGNGLECSAGTIAARVKDPSGGVFALSNNHVYALENNADLGSDIMQPGLYDTNCNPGKATTIGALYDFVPINFNCQCKAFCTCDATKNNVIDAAIALSSTANLKNSTPSNGYGIPKSEPVGASLNMAVQKYGRTTSLTKGYVTGINATVRINYGPSGTAQFVNQIIVQGSKGAFLNSGDSGSSMVTDPGRDPVGLLFAGDASGKTGIANPIGPVLSAFGVTIDGE